jgi:hypothetical protein
MSNPFRYFNSSPGIIRLTVMLYVRYPLSLRQVEDILFERGEAVRSEYGSSVEVAVLVEVVVDRGVGGGELLQGLEVPEAGHRTFSSSEGLV